MAIYGKAVFIISFDCEGKWGMADHITMHHQKYLTNKNLIEAYRKLLAVLDKWDIDATFAFVMAFTLSQDEFRGRADLFQDVQVRGQNWLSTFRIDTAAGSSEGWFVPQALESVQAVDRHEIACHGFSHLPLAEGLVGETQARHELGAAVEIAGVKGLELKTFVYPRNQIGHLQLLQECRFLGYRQCLPRRPGRVGKVSMALSELNPFTVAQPIAPHEGQLTAVPPAYFLNWRAGFRKFVPPFITVARWRHIIADAVRHGKVAHLFMHPHNIIDGPGALAMLGQILGCVAAHRDRGELEVLTQAAFCERYGAREGSTRGVPSSL